MKKLNKGRIDWLITLAPFIIIMALAGVLFIFPDQSNNIIGKVRFFFGDTLGIYYLVIGLGVLLISIYLSLSKYGNVVLGEPNEKPKYSFFAWGSMMFTCGLAADILFYSFAEWVMYATNPHIAELGSITEWAGVFPPLMAAIIVDLFGITISRTAVTIIILLITCAVYTYAVLHGFKGISFLAKLCIYLFFGLLLIVLFIGGQGRFIVENGFQSLGKMIQNFIELSTFTDPARTSNFAQDWTIYYWAYWMVWCIAAPFFIGNISRGRTIKQTILGGYVFGVGSTIVSFIVLGNYSLGLQTSGAADFIAQYTTDGDLYGLILSIINTMPASKVILVITMLCMIAFYATSFDSIAYTAACYSYKQLGENEHPHKLVELLWCVLLIVLPIALVFSESSMSNIQSVSIISAFPIGIIMIIMISGFFKDLKNYQKETSN